MKFTRRDFLRGGLITAAALAVGLKPDEIIFSPVVDLFADFEYYWPMDGDFLDGVPHDPEQIARAFRMPPVTKPITWPDMEAALRKMARRPDNSAYFAWLEEAWLELQFLHGDPRFHCRGVLVVKGDEHA